MSSGGQIFVSLDIHLWKPSRNDNQFFLTRVHSLPQSAHRLQRIGAKLLRSVSKRSRGEALSLSAIYPNTKQERAAHERTSSLLLRSPAGAPSDRRPA